LVEEYLGIFSY